MLAVTFTDLATFSREFHRNLTKGGIFVPSDQVFELRSHVEVGIELAFCQESVVLTGEVVHCVPPELASAGAIPGVAIQFDRPTAELRALFRGFVGDIPKPGSAPQREGPAPAEERRESEREPARVVARVAGADGEELRGMTRNLSAHGLLFSVAGEPPPIGASVVVRLTNSISGESLDIPAEVVRHVEGEAGDVPALGIHFSPEADSQERTQAFLQRLSETEHTRRLGGISGDIEELGLPNLLQSFGVSSQAGTIIVIHENQEGYIAFEQGELVATRVGRVRGIKALTRMLQWERGRFEFHARIDPEIVRDTPTHLEGALLEALREHDEAARPGRPGFAADTQFALSDEAIQRVAPEFGKIESACVDLVRVGANMRKLLDVIPETDGAVQAAIEWLVENEALVPISRDP